MERTIKAIALILLLIAFFSSPPASTINNTNNAVDVTTGNIDNEAPQDEDCCSDAEPEESESIENNIYPYF